MKKGRSWKTTVGGFLAAIGSGMQLSGKPTLSTIGVIIGGLGTFLLGLAAKDSNVTGGTIENEKNNQLILKK